MTQSPEWRRGEMPGPVALLRAWWEAAGEGLARTTTVCGIRNGILEVEVADRAWEGVLAGHREEILARLRNAPGGSGIRDLRIRCEERRVAGGPPDPAGYPPAAAPGEIREAASRIPDPELARRWVETVGRLLARRSVQGGE